MKIKSIEFLPIGKEIYLGSNPDFCNRYKRISKDKIEVQHIYRFGKSSKTKIMNSSEFDNYVKQ